MSYTKSSTVNRCLMLVLLLSFIAGSGCGQGNERLAERAGIEGKANAEAQVKVENEKVALRVGKMEADLQRRHTFYQAVKGTYEGSIQTELGHFNVRLTLVPTLSPFSSDRIRTEEEITNDLNNLKLNIQVIQWNPNNNLSAVGCRVENINADIKNGEISIASADCPNMYLMRLSDHESPDLSSRLISEGIMNGNETSVSMLVGRIQPTTNATRYDFSASRIKD